MNRRRTAPFLVIAPLVILGVASCDLMVVTSVESRAMDASSHHAVGVPGVGVTLTGAAGVYHTTTDHAGYRLSTAFPPAATPSPCRRGGHRRARSKACL